MMDYKKMSNKEIQNDEAHIKFMDNEIKKDEEIIKKHKAKEIRHDKKNKYFHFILLFLKLIKI